MGGGTKKPKSAFDFQSASKAEAEKQAALKQQDDLKSLHKAKYEKFKADPNAGSSAAYRQPPSVAPNGQAPDDSGSQWWNPFSWGSGPNMGGGGNDKPDRQGPRMKSINDLPKQRR